SDLNYFHGVEHFAQYPHVLKIILRYQALFAAGAGFLNMNRREYTFFSSTAIKVQLHVTRTLKLFENHFIHFRASFHKGGGKNSEAAAFFNITRSTKKAFRAFESVGIHTTGDRKSV